LIAGVPYTPAGDLHFARASTLAPFRSLLRHHRRLRHLAPCWGGSVPFATYRRGPCTPARDL